MIDIIDVEIEMKEIACSYFSYEPRLSEFKIVDGRNDFGVLKVLCEVNEIGKVAKKISFNISIDEEL